MSSRSDKTQRRLSQAVTTFMYFQILMSRIMVNNGPEQIGTFTSFLIGKKDLDIGRLDE